MAYLGDIPAKQLWKNVIDTREKLAQLRVAAGQPDPFVVPANLNRTSDGPNGGNTGNVLAAAITANILGLPSPDIHKIKRGDMNNAIALMNTAIQGLTTPGTQIPASTVSTAALTSALTTPSSVTVTPTTPVTSLPSQVPMISPTPTILSPVQAGVAAAPSFFDPSSPYFPYVLGGGLLLAVLLSRRQKGK